jgi:outer membrane protein assembly factor BamD
MLQKYIYSIFLMSFLILLPACSSKKDRLIKPKKTIALERLYEEAYINFQNNDYQSAVELFQLVEKDYSYTEWASKALLMRAFIYYDTSDYIQSLENLKKFKTRYSGNKNIPYADYLIGLCLYEQINFISMSQENTQLAKRQFTKIISNYPSSSYASDSKFKLDLIEDQLAGKEMYIAKYYLEREKWTAALIRLNNIFNNYETTVYIEEALHRLVEINYKIGNIPAAKKYAAILGYNYNDSDWYRKSFNIVEKKNIISKNTKDKKKLKERLKNLIQ